MTTHTFMFHDRVVRELHIGILPKCSKLCYCCQPHYILVGSVSAPTRMRWKYANQISPKQTPTSMQSCKSTKQYNRCEMCSFSRCFFLFAQNLHADKHSICLSLASDTRGSLLADLGGLLLGRNLLGGRGGGLLGGLGSLLGVLGDPAEDRTNVRFCEQNQLTSVAVGAVQLT